ncbi:HEAT repeat domain-containing protein [Chloroflexi bacterium TSY]|nr:HEAT repeat domain-containing protein [Chloroflexi bacterium TSY]
MGKKRKGLNKHQKAIFKKGDHRIRREDVLMYLEMSISADPKERLEAAENLCPCHVRTSSEDVQQALFRMMEDSDNRVRRAAWHTLEDGGVPDVPELESIFERAMQNETDPGVRRFIEEVAQPHLREKAIIENQRVQRSIFAERGKCDFCGESNIPVKRDFETEITTLSETTRLAYVCEECSE